MPSETTTWKANDEHEHQGRNARGGDGERSALGSGTGARSAVRRQIRLLRTHNRCVLPSELCSASGPPGKRCVPHNHRRRGTRRLSPLPALQTGPALDLWQHAALVAKLCHLLETSEQTPSLAELARQAQLSAFHLHRVFKRITGLTPKAYASAHRSKRLRVELRRSATVTDAIYDAGYNSGGRFYADADKVLGMTPTRYRAGGADTEIRFAIGQCSLGAILVARSDRGVCAISLGDDPDELARDLQDRFPRARLIGDDAEFAELVAKVVGFVEAPRLGLNLPPDAEHGQQRVWQRCAISLRRTASYADTQRPARRRRLRRCARMRSQCAGGYPSPAVVRKRWRTVGLSLGSRAQARAPFARRRNERAIPLHLRRHATTFMDASRRRLAPEYRPDEQGAAVIDRLLTWPNAATSRRSTSRRSLLQPRRHGEARYGRARSLLCYPSTRPARCGDFHPRLAPIANRCRSGWRDRTPGPTRRFIARCHAAVSRADAPAAAVRYRHYNCSHQTYASMFSRCRWSYCCQEPDATRWWRICHDRAAAAHAVARACAATTSRRRCGHRGAPRLRRQRRGARKHSTAPGPLGYRHTAGIIFMMPPDCRPCTPRVREMCLNHRPAMIPARSRRAEGNCPARRRALRARKG